MENIKINEAVILCGGSGERLRSVISDKPKVLAPIGESAFIDILLGQLFNVGVRRIILCSGYLKEHIREHAENHGLNKRGVTFVFSEEDEPLGTGGALKKALRHIVGDVFFVLNGDSYCNVPLDGFLEFHKKKNTLVSIVVTKDIREDSGGVLLGDEDSIAGFLEKNSASNDCFMNGGIYLFQKDITRHFPEDDVFSLEYDVFPHLVEVNQLHGMKVLEKVYDIGTPERYSYAQKVLAGNNT